jgi:ATP-dependent DNA helicase RecG
VHVQLAHDLTVAELERRLGDTFRTATEVQKLARVTVALEKEVTHARLRSMSETHPRDITVALASLVQRGALESGGSHKRTYYYFPGQPPPDDPALGFESAARGEPPPPGAVMPGAPRPLRAKRRLPPAELEAGIRDLCRGRYLTGTELAALSGRSAETLRTHYLNRMVADRKLRLRYPDSPTHPAQAYTAV